MKKNTDIPLRRSAAPAQIFIIALASILVIQLTKKNLELREQRDSLQNQIRSVKVLEYSILEGGGFPLWPTPSENETEAYHEVLETFNLEGHPIPYKVHVLKRLGTNTKEVGIVYGDEGFSQNQVTRTFYKRKTNHFTDTSIESVDPEQAKEVLDRFEEK